MKRKSTRKSVSERQQQTEPFGVTFAITAATDLVAVMRMYR